MYDGHKETLRTFLQRGVKEPTTTDRKRALIRVRVPRVQQRRIKPLERDFWRLSLN